MSVSVSTGVFQALQKDFLENVSLGALVPELDRSHLLTEAEKETLSDESVTHHNRVVQLTKILATKGPNSPYLVVQCLRREGGAGHMQLADCMERYLSEKGTHSKEAEGKPKETGKK